MDFFAPRQVKKTKKAKAPVKRKASEPTMQPVKRKAEPAGNASDLMWKDLAQLFEDVESTTKRLEITAYVRKYLLRGLRNDEAGLRNLQPAVWLMSNRLGPQYEGLETGVGDSLVKDLLTAITSPSIINAKLKTEPDLGSIAASILVKQNRHAFSKPKPLYLPQLMAELHAICKLDGEGVRKEKRGRIQRLVNNCTTAPEIKFLVRTVLPKGLRIGLKDPTILTALSQAAAAFDSKLGRPSVGDEKDAERVVKAAFASCPNYDILLDAVKTHGLAELPKLCVLRSGIPVNPMLAKPMKSVESVITKLAAVTDEITCEYKYDGERAQVHFTQAPDGTTAIQIFSRNMEDMSRKYPDLVDVVAGCRAVISPEIADLIRNGSMDEAANDPNLEVGAEVTSFVVDCEAVAYNVATSSILPFQTLMSRQKKVTDEITVDVALFAFDMILINGVRLLDHQLKDRRTILRSVTTEGGKFRFAIGEDFVITSEDGAEPTDVIGRIGDLGDDGSATGLLDASVKASCEGLMAKALTGPGAHYQPSVRSTHWLKLKKDYLGAGGDTLDLVVMGGRYGTGDRAGKLGTFLLGCRGGGVGFEDDDDDDVYKYITDCGSGLKDEDLIEYSKDEYRVDRKPAEYVVSTQNTAGKKLDDVVWFRPGLIWEIKFADITVSPKSKGGVGADPKKPGLGLSLRFPRCVRRRDDKTLESISNDADMVDAYQRQSVVANNKGDDDFY
ncbi:DNA ligase 1, DNLI1 [Carpediemonas membranifera]|uniref:DNA ligase n=1 Tax=Carpediemonas membranifera TaxID=201153 RepID=A0A8J6AXX9_9EUKA|nr:DNA ligase 1, DNLI1 [Carpediemonas membranifera]|eukprot:KAG9394215.1 DNA ligase 1, DNLI1 [Carpediemonas membranifera]